jgi:hypothetical protein
MPVERLPVIVSARATLPMAISANASPIDIVDFDRILFMGLMGLFVAD